MPGLEQQGHKPAGGGGGGELDQVAGAQILPRAPALLVERPGGNTTQRAETGHHRPETGSAVAELAAQDERDAEQAQAQPEPAPPPDALGQEERGRGRNQQWL